MKDTDKSRLTLNIPIKLREAAEAEAERRFTSLTGLILQALSKEVESK